MGGRGSKSGLLRAPRLTMPQQQQPQPQVQPLQPPQPPQPQPDLTPSSDLQTATQATATLAQIASMTDDQLAQAVIDSRNVDMPNFLNDVPDQTQKFVYQVGLNGAPTVMDQQQFNQFMQQNNIPRSEIMSRSVNGNGPYSAQNIADMFKYSEMNYIGGKKGGQVSGAGTYFDMNGGRNTGYGSGATIQAVLNPATARTVDYYALRSQAQSFASSHPQFARAVGSFRYGGNGNASIYALAMGYNVITGGPVTSTYRNVIDRSAVVVLK